MTGFMPDLTATEQAPPGALPREVADDVPAMLSDGEYVVPADVLRWHGMKTFEEMRQEAKMGFLQMEDEGRLQGPGMAQEEPPDDFSYPGSEEDMDSPEFNLGGFLSDYPEFASGGLLMAPETYASYMNDYGSPGEKEAPDRVSNLGFWEGLGTFGANVPGFMSPVGAVLGFGKAMLDPQSPKLGLMTSLIDPVIDALVSPKDDRISKTALLDPVIGTFFGSDPSSSTSFGPSANAAIGTNEATTEARDAAYGGSWGGGDDSSGNHGNDGESDPEGDGDGGPGDGGDGW